MSAKTTKDSKWIVTEEGTDAKTIRQNETLFALSNGHIGTRGSLEEAERTKEYSHSEATLVNAYYDSEPIQYGEWAYGYAKEHQTVIPVPNGKKLAIRLENDLFDLTTGKTTNHKRQLDLKKGLLTRSFTWENTQGHKLDVKIERFVSYDYPELLAQNITLTPQDDGCDLQMVANLDDLKELGNITEEESNDPRIKAHKERRFQSKRLEDFDNQLLHIETNNTHLHLIVGEKNQLSDPSVQSHFEDGAESWKLETKKGDTIQLERLIAYSNIFHEESKIEDKAQRLTTILNEASAIGFKGLKEKHIAHMEEFWELSDIEIVGDDELQVGLRFNLFHLYQAAGRDGKRNMSAKGLSGEGYEGHYFWDTEMYMLPFFLYTQPKIAKHLLNYRYTILEEARNRAREMAVDNGALFAWRTINGKEASPYYPAGTAQIHINGDIAHAVHTYVKATGDKRFGMKEGLEILVETARFYAGWGHFDEKRKGAFVLNDVTGPDEYTAIVNNNYYTNLMAKHNFKYAAEMVEAVLESNDEDGLGVLKRIGYDKAELENWKKAADKMFLPYDDEQQLTMQDDSFFHKEVWDIENTPKENFPLLLHYHPLTIYRYQVNKQADTVLAQFLFPDEFSQEQKARDYDYYESVTTHDSSLSRSVFGMMASDLGQMEKAYNYFMDTALMDITDLQSNTRDGVHAANMGGTWMSMVNGFGGMRLVEDRLHFRPRLPKDWTCVTFKVQFRHRLIKVSISKDDTEYTLIKGEPLVIRHFDEEKHLK
ncbi:alpha,alpha-trehalose phosphorylase [Alkalibacterium subtropicum]|uniref:Alpha,alpha-trehalose phosphorylase n=1 Tax=Alkalibacterium subtropicum TaxID=753702 RepID=A0A1I1KHZ9_9LACT|nr:glycosyl hydrolase family 65 protein [Alkalibacterium subtropicum]SFC57050.1 alpha,alpha-trehalose phosphorylase [Alkalibacterium subtropicum]